MLGAIFASWAAWLILSVIISFFIGRELALLLRKAGFYIPHVWMSATSSILAIFFVLWSMGIIDLIYLFIPFTILFLYAVIIFLIGKSVSAAIISLAGLLYSSIPFALAAFFYTHYSYIIPGSTGQDLFEVYTGFNPYLLSLIFVFIWIYDSTAYISGSLIGKTAMAPAISPGKTWEGSIGGFIITIIAGILVHVIFDIFNPGMLIGLAGVICISGTLGDLLASVIKRHAGTKESGNLLPGHGGILDRFDSFLLAMPFTLLYFIILFPGF